MKRRFNRGDGVVQNQPMDMRKKEKHEQAVSWWQVRMLIIVAAILFLLVSLSFNVGRNESSHIASTQTHVSTKANFHPPIENNPNSRGTSNNKQLDAVIHVGLFKTGTTTIQGALGWSLYEDLLKDNYYFLGRTGGQNFMNVTEKGIVTGRDTVRETAKLFV